MSSFHDPISLLREYTLEEKKVDFTGGNLFFGNIKVPLNHLTAWKPRTSGKQYSIGSLWFFLKNRDILAFGAYLQECRRLGIELVSRPDQDETVSYFTGATETAEAIDEELRMQTQIERAKADEKEVKRAAVREVLERPICTKDSVLQAQSTSFKYLLELCQPYLKTEGKRPREKVVRPLIEEILSMSQYAMDLQTRPIIIVPGIAVSGNLSLQNAVDFLARGVYTEPVGLPPDNLQQPLQVTRRIRGNKVTFDIYDNTLSFSKKHWKCLVAIFVQNPRYQFKDWPQSLDIVKWFTLCRGFYLKFSDVPLDESVSRLNVKVLNVQRHKRHSDKELQNEIWREIERFLMCARAKV
jgi:hypothetical protein